MTYKLSEQLKRLSDQSPQGWIIGPSRLQIWSDQIAILENIIEKTERAKENKMNNHIHHWTWQDDVEWFRCVDCPYESDLNLMVMSPNEAAKLLSKSTCKHPDTLMGDTDYSPRNRRWIRRRVE